MYITRILNEEEVKEFSKNYGINFYSVMIKQEKNNFYAILDCDVKIKLYRKEVMRYL